MMRRIVKTGIKAGVVLALTAVSVVLTIDMNNMQLYAAMIFGVFSSVVNGFMTLAYGLEFYNELKEFNYGITEL